MKAKKNTLIIYIVQTFAWAWMILTPVIVQYMLSGKLSMGAATSLLPLFVIYMLNFSLLVPKFLFSNDKSKKIWFFIINFIVIAAWDTYRFMPKGPVPDMVMDFFGQRKISSFVFFGNSTVVLVQLMVAAAAVGIRQIIRTSELKLQMAQQRRDAAEAEISWLKNQINPHFLFNTLNNISSLTQIDAEKAQDSIGQLSDLLRYALYESDAEKVKIGGEIEFMKNYVELMKLRCNDLTKVDCSLNVTTPEAMIAPLLFISLIENAFKHGVNSRKESFVNIMMENDGNDIVFRCENSVFEKQATDRIGSGIGLENMKRRLELIYPGAYEYESSSDGQTYRTMVRIKGIA